MITITLIILAMITFGTRYLFIHPNLPISLPPRIQKVLAYSAPAVLTAIWVPIIFIQEKTLNLSMNNPYLLGAIVGAGIAWRYKSIYWTALGGGLVFVLIKYWV